MINRNNRLTVNRRVKAYLKSADQDQPVVFTIWGRLYAFSIGICCINEYNVSLVGEEFGKSKERSGKISFIIIGVRLGSGILSINLTNVKLMCGNRSSSFSFFPPYFPVFLKFLQCFVLPHDCLLHIFSQE